MTTERRVRSSALRYALNAREEELLHYYLVRRLRRDPQRSSPNAEAYSRLATTRDDYHVATIRSSLRIFLGTAAGLKMWELVLTSLLSRGSPQR